MLVRSGRCARHSAPRYPDTRPSAARRGYDRRWRELRAALLRRSPLCEPCRDRGRTTLASEVHHIVPVRLRPDLRLEVTNLLSVCRACHAALTGAERHAEGIPGSNSSTGPTPETGRRPLPARSQVSAPEVWLR